LSDNFSVAIGLIVVSAVESPKQAGISETLSICDDDIDFAVLGGEMKGYCVQAMLE
jgi:hypothetical protein